VDAATELLKTTGTSRRSTEASCWGNRGGYMEQHRFIENIFAVSGYKTLGGLNSHEGELIFLIAPQTKDKNNVRFTIYNQDENDKVIGKINCLISQRTMALILHQMNTVLDFANELKMDKDLYDSVNEETMITFNEYNSPTCSCGGELEVL
jgi:hypothetical protein